MIHIRLSDFDLLVCRHDLLSMRYHGRWFLSVVFCRHQIVVSLNSRLVCFLVSLQSYWGVLSIDSGQVLFLSIYFRQQDSKWRRVFGWADLLVRDLPAPTLPAQIGQSHQIAGM